MASPTCTVDAASTTDGVNVAIGSTVTIALVDSTNLLNWSLTCFATDDQQTTTAINANIVINLSAKTATLTVPSTIRGCALLIKSTINNGVDYNGDIRSDYVDKFGIFALGTTQTRLLAVNQTYESNATFGWIADMNNLLAGGLTFNPAATIYNFSNTGTLTTQYLMNNRTTYLDGGIKYFTEYHSTTADFNCDSDKISMCIYGTANFDLYLSVPSPGRMIKVISNNSTIVVKPNSGELVNFTTNYTFSSSYISSKLFISNGNDWFLPNP